MIAARRSAMWTPLAETATFFSLILFLSTASAQSIFSRGCHCAAQFAAAQFAAPQQQELVPLRQPKELKTHGARITDCCCNCNDPCRFRKLRLRSAAHGILNQPGSFNITVDPLCSSQVLRRIMKRKLGNDTETTKREIKKVAEKVLLRKFGVICSTTDFSYVLRSTHFCQYGNGNITCFAFSIS